MAPTKERKRHHGASALERSFPARWGFMLDQDSRRVFQVIFVGVSFGCIYGSPVASTWVYLLAAVFGPVAISLWYSINPWNPYGSVFPEYDESKSNDAHGAAATRLVRMLSSTEARRFLFSRGICMSLLLSVPMVVLSFVRHRWPSAGIGWDNVIRIPFFLLVLLPPLSRMQLIAWALRNWDTSEKLVA